MNKITLLSGFIGFLASPAFCDQTNFVGGMETPANEFSVRADYTNSLNDEALAESLGIKHWNFQLQITNNWACYSMDFLWTENGTVRDLGHGEIPISNIDPQTGKAVPGMFQDNILLLISPVDTSTEDPWRNSTKLRVFTKNSHGSGSLLIENPFKKNKQMLATFGEPALVAKSSSKIEFKLMTADTNEFRISFNLGLHTTFNNKAP